MYAMASYKLYSSRLRTSVSLYPLLYAHTFTLQYPDACLFRQMVNILCSLLPPKSHLNPNQFTSANPHKTHLNVHTHHNSNMMALQTSEHCKRLSLHLLFTSAAASKPPLPPSTTYAAKTTSTPAAPASQNLFDVDANLTHADLYAQAAQHIANAQRAGVRHMINPGSCLEDSQTAVGLAQRFPGSIFACIGVHPYCAAQVGNDLDSMYASLEKLLLLPSNARFVVGVGECGLDYSEGFPERNVQQKVFLKQIKLAHTRHMPLFLHERLAHSDFIGCLESAFAQHPGLAKPPLLIHCFTGTEEELKVYVNMGCFVSISGSIFRNNQRKNELQFLRIIPEDRIMVETDAPYLGFPGCRKPYYGSKKKYPNVPSALPMIIEEVSSIRLAKRLFRN